MLSSFNNPWLVVTIDPLWAVRQATETFAKCIDPDLLTDPQSMADYCTDPSEQRLNPFDFHGKRRPASPACAHGHVAVSSSRIGRRESGQSGPHSTCQRRNQQQRTPS